MLNFLLHLQAEQLGLTNFAIVMQFASQIAQRCQPHLSHSTVHYEVAAILAVALKLIYAFNDTNHGLMTDPPSLAP